MIPRRCQYLSVCVCVCFYISVCVCVCVCVYIYTDVCGCVCVCRQIVPSVFPYILAEEMLPMVVPQGLLVVGGEEVHFQDHMHALDFYTREGSSTEEHKP